MKTVMGILVYRLCGNNHEHDNKLQIKTFNTCFMTSFGLLFVRYSVLNSYYIGYTTHMLVGHVNTLVSQIRQTVSRKSKVTIICLSRTWFLLQMQAKSLVKQVLV